MLLPLGHMASSLSCLLLLITLTSTLHICCIRTTSAEDRMEYIVYMGDLPKGDVSASALHINMLHQMFDSGASEYLLHSYKRSFNGFVAKLTTEEMKKLSAMDGVVSVFPNGKKKLLTTRSWDFMGFPQEVKRTATESDVIIAMLDSGIWPESSSFSDEGFGPPPSKWKGTCQTPSNFTCNNKIIGAKYYRSDGKLGPTDIKSPRDSEGHGSHTASIAAGRIVRGASLLGLGSGTARGGVPLSRIAVYKICWSDGCSDADILAGFDDAIADGVDIISLSVGGIDSYDYFYDSIAIGAFHSMKNGILTSNAAGNWGPNLATITNFSPWSLSVAASTIDRKFVTKVKLGNNKVYEGASINTFEMKGMYSIIYGGDATNTTGGYDSSSRYCFWNTVDKSLVNGKILFCDLDTDGVTAFAAGAVGTVFQERYNDFATSYALPASSLGLSDGGKVLTYLHSTSKPIATIEKSVEVKDKLAPFVASFSSRGPNPVTSDILKPDLTAPGVDIIAAWTKASTVTGYEWDTRVVPYNIVSGTSMACPHASGAAAYVKSFHPTWSPAAIKSALMTTAAPMSVKSNKDQEFAYGAGQIDPVKAAHPGLIYDAGEADYVNFLCGQGYSTEQLRIISGDKSACSAAPNATVWNLNYPSFAVSIKSGANVTRIFARTVTNVGSADSTYRAILGVPSGLNVQVEPSVLPFKSLGQKKTFSVRVSTGVDKPVISGSLVWDDGIHQVRSPIVAFISS